MKAANECVAQFRWNNDNRWHLFVARAIMEARDKALEDAADCQPSTAENPNEDAYQRGRFDGIMEFARAIRAMKSSARQDAGIDKPEMSE